MKNTFFFGNAGLFYELLTYLYQHEKKKNKSYLHLPKKHQKELPNHLIVHNICDYFFPQTHQSEVLKGFSFFAEYF